MIRALTTAILLLPNSALAETVMAPAEFEQFSTGKTLYFYRSGQFFGAEQFFDGKRSTWQFVDGQCMDGRWWAEGNLICFTYDLDPRNQCWQVLQTTMGHVVRGEGMPPALDIDLGRMDTTPLDCPAPDFGS